MNRSAPELLFRDAFLSEQLGRSVLRVTHERLPGAAVELAQQFCELREPVMLYARLPADAPCEMKRILVELGFECVEAAVTLEREPLTPAEHPVCSGAYRIRKAKPHDEDSIAILARSLLTTSRFHRDRHLAAREANDIKEAWARNYFRGRRGDGMIVAQDVLSQELAGFLLALRSLDGAMVIDLVAVAERARRCGLCRAMTFAAQSLFPEARLIRVGTQGSNEASLQAYRRMGFSVVREETLWHAHRPGAWFEKSIVHGARIA